jgi:hypothetical protein
LNFTKLNQSNPDVYSPPHVVGAECFVIAGGPDQAYISSSLFERQNLTMRMSLRRFTRLMNASSKGREPSRRRVLARRTLQLRRVHKTLRVTPPMKAHVSDRLWSLDELVERTSR